MAYDALLTPNTVMHLTELCVYKDKPPKILFYVFCRC